MKYVKINMPKNILIIILIAVVILGFDCKKNPVTPPSQGGVDTTSHNWAFTIDTLGDGGSTLNDVTIISTDPLEVYAVGYIYSKDSSGNINQQPFSIAQWNGNTWLLKRLYYKDKDYQGNPFIAILSLTKGILAFNNNDFWLADGSVFRWNGSDSIAGFSYDILTSSGLLPGILKIWGSSSFDLYGIGYSGSIIHYTNGIWQKIASGITDDMQDVWGYKNKTTGQTTVLSISSTVFYGGTENLISITTGLQQMTLGTATNDIISAPLG